MHLLTQGIFVNVSTSLFPELTQVADVSAVVPMTLPTDLGLPFSGTTQGKTDSEGELKKEDIEAEVAKDKDDKMQRKKKKRKEKKKKARSREDDIALDIRPELVQAKDILV